MDDPKLLVGFGDSDDAGVYSLSDELAVVHTADIITPVTDDPYAFGQVAAANALSDVYAMGAKPVTALNLAFFPGKGIPMAVLRAILQGSHDKVREAGAVVVGGHTLLDDELKFGLAVTGTCDPRRFLPNSAALAGDRLVLTKPIGTGVIIGGYRDELLDDAAVERAVGQMRALNDVASREALEHSAHGATDVTGFGLAGHAREMAVASGVGLRFWFDRIPCYTESLRMIREGVSTRVTGDNKKSVGGLLRLAQGLSSEQETLLYDPQTSGGLLVSLPAERADAYVARLQEQGVTEAAVVGEVLEAAAPYIEILARRAEGPPQGSSAAC